MLQLADIERRSDEISAVDVSPVRAAMKVDQTRASEMRARLNKLQNDLAKQKEAAGLPVASFSLRDPDEFV